MFTTEKDSNLCIPFGPSIRTIFRQVEATPGWGLPSHHGRLRFASLDQAISTTHFPSWSSWTHTDSTCKDGQKLRKSPQKMASNASQNFTKELYHDQKFHWRLGLFLQLFTLLLGESTPQSNRNLTGMIWGKLLQSTTFPGSTGCPLPSSLWGKKILAPSARWGALTSAIKHVENPVLCGESLSFKDKPYKKIDLLRSLPSLEVCRHFRTFSASQRQCVWDSTLLRVT